MRKISGVDSKRSIEFKTLIIVLKFDIKIGYISFNCCIIKIGLCISLGEGYFLIWMTGRRVISEFIWYFFTIIVVVDVVDNEIAKFDFNGFIIVDVIGWR